MSPFRALAMILALCGMSATSGPPPSVEDLKHTLEAALVRLKPAQFTTRTVLFDDVTAVAQDGTGYPFVVTVNIHDYSSGAPSKQDYGRTCLRRMDQWTFALTPDSVAGWKVSGRLAGADSVCMDNPAAGESAIPLESLAPAERPPVDDDAGNLPAGEWACYNESAQLLPKMAFVLKASGKYTDADGARGGTFVYSAGRSEITFRGGFLHGQIGTNVQSSGFELSDTVTCEPKK